MKAQFYLGLGLGAAAAGAAVLLAKPGRPDMKKTVDAAKQAVGKALRKLGG